jgi:hypothetical protein
MAENLTGQKFGKLTVVEKAGNNKQGKQMWVCKCDCGKIKSKPALTYELKSGKVKSCGCLYFESNKERNKTHGLTHSRLYQVWQGVISRCYYIKNAAFKNYGGRGITVCEEWRNSFESFYEWAMSHGYSDELTLDRINVNGNYCPKNCRWVSMKEQQNNRRNNKIVSYKNKEYTIAQLAEKLNLSSETLRWRLNNGWDKEDLSLPPSLNNKNIRGKKQ